MTGPRPPLPGVGPDLAADLTRWAHDTVWEALVGAFGGDPSDMPADTADRLAWLDQFSDRWDARHGVLERDQAGELPLTPAQADLVGHAADHLGMRTALPPRFAEYDHVLALGGLIRACFLRPAYAAHLLASETVHSPSFIGLGGHRPFSEEERSLAAQSGLAHLDSEFGALDTGVRDAFRLGTPVSARGAVETTPGGSWTIHEYQGAHGLCVSVVAAPSSQPLLRRANTADAYRFMADELAHLRPGQRLLAVTTPIYVPAQHAAAVATLGLPYGVVVDTVGTDPSVGAPRWEQSFSPTRYLMEFRSAIRGMRALRIARGT